MTALPRALSGWAKELAIFDPEPALVLGQMASRIAALLGSGATGDQRGEPDGYSGLARRGSYEHLLMSEWLLQEELPEEFLRRVAAGEHAFLARAYESAPASRRTIALFDAGIDQLGGPRVVHLAILVALARRAAEKNGTLSWGVLQDGAMTLHDGVTETSVRDLLKARTRVRPAPQDFERWGPRILEAGADRWLVGARRIAPRARALDASAITLAESLDPNASARIVADLHAVGWSRPRTVTFELPAASVAIRLLRDPFGGAAPKRPPPPRDGGRGSIRIDPRTNLVHASDGRWVYARGEDGTVVHCPVPNSPAAQPPPIVAFRPSPGQHVVAIGRAGKERRSAVVTVSDDGIFLLTLSKRGAAVNEIERHDFPAGYADVRSAELRPLRMVSRARTLFLDGAGSLVEVDGGRLVVVDRAKAQASVSTPAGLLYVTLAGAGRQVVCASESGRHLLEQVSEAIQKPSTDFQLVFGWGHRAVAYKRSSTWWVLVKAGEDGTKIDVPQEACVFGIVWRSGTLELAALDESRTRVLAIGESGSAIILTSPLPIETATVVAGDRLAFVRADGELAIYSLQHSAFVLHLPRAVQ